MPKDNTPTRHWRPQTELVRGGLARSGFDETSEALYLTSAVAIGAQLLSCRDNLPTKPAPKLKRDAAGKRPNSGLGLFRH